MKGIFRRWAGPLLLASTLIAPAGAADYLPPKGTDWARRTPAQAGFDAAKLQAAIDFAVETSRMPEDKVYTGVLKVVANAGQTFSVRVQVEVQGNKKGWFGGRKSSPTLKRWPHDGQRMSNRESSDADAAIFPPESSCD